MLDNKRQVLINYYTDPNNQETFLNASKSYAKAYPRAKRPDTNAYRVFGEEEVKKGIEGKLNALFDISLQEYAGLLNKEYLNAQNKDSTRLRALELLGKVKQFLNDNTSVNVSSTYINSEDIKERLKDKSARLNGCG